MNKCSPAVMRKNLLVAEQFKKFGIGFVPVPVRDLDHKNEIMSLANKVLEEIVEESEGLEDE